MGTILHADSPERAHATLIFHHIPKTAGSTLNAVLDANYPAPAIHSIESPIADALTALRLLPAEKRRALRVVRGHGVWGVHAWLEQPCLYATLLRDPVDRLLSQYYFIRGSPQHPLHAEVMARGRTLRDYLQNGVNLQADNGQVRALSHAASDTGEAPYGACTRAMLQTAMDNLSSRYALVGITEHFDEFLALAGRVLGWRHLGYARRKVTKSRPAVEALDASERAMIMRYNALDVELYAAACTQFEAARRR
jgi:hypothetical protein